MKKAKGAPKVRVKAEVEKVIDKLSEWYGVPRFTIRNTALLYGLADILLGGALPSDDDEFEGMLELIRIWVEEIELALEEGEKKKEEGKEEEEKEDEKETNT